MKRLFGTDGIRGIVNENLTGDLAYKVGLATAKLLNSNTFRYVKKDTPFKDNKPVVLIGTDTRPSKDLIFSGIACGLCAGGVNVISVGILPTPAIAYLTKTYPYISAGVMITASHNPKQYNGIKIIGPDGYKLPDLLEEQIESLISNISDSTMPSFLQKNCGIISYKFESSAKTDYLKYLSSIFNFDEKKRPLKIALDCSNGAASNCSELFELLKLYADKYNTDLSGEHINEGCGSMHLEFLQKMLSTCNNFYDCGIAFDGDADRCLLVDEKGEIVDGDQILAIVGNYLKEQGKLKNNTIVGTVMSNLGLVNFCKNNNLKFLSTKVGDKYVLEEMITNDCNIGGEQSGHIIFKDYATTGDGLLTALMVLNIIHETQTPLSKLKDMMFKYPQVSTQIVADSVKKNAFVANTSLKEDIRSLVDKTLNGDGRAVVRPSGTENYIRVMVEGKDYNTISNLCDNIRDMIQKSIG